MTRIRPAREGVMNDSRGNRIDYLRISLTDLCNFHCMYCMPESGLRKIDRENMLRFEEVLAVVELMVRNLGIRKIRITGGEPLVRRGVIGFLKELCAIPGLREIALTTNGHLLDERAEMIRDAGVGRLNISLDTLRADLFQEITRVDGLGQVLRGIDRAVRSGFSAIKLNVVAMQENLDEAVDFISFGVRMGVEVRFIERMPIEGTRYGTFVSNGEVMRRIGRTYRLVPIDADVDSHAPARRYRICGHETICGFISPITSPFCDRCNRLRLRGDGRLIPCLRGATQFDLMPLIRPVLRGQEIEEVVRRVVETDTKEGDRAESLQQMSMIGG